MSLKIVGHAIGGSETLENQKFNINSKSGMAVEYLKYN